MQKKTIFCYFSVSAITGQWVTSVTPQYNNLDTLESFAASKYLACGIKLGHGTWTEPPFSEAQITWCHEFNWSTSQTSDIIVGSLTDAETLSCAQNSYIKGINAVIEQTSREEYKAILDRAALGVLFGAPTTYSADYYWIGHVEYVNPALGENYGYHNDCGGSAIWTVNMPNDQPLYVTQLLWQKRPDGCCEGRVTTGVKIRYKQEDDTWVWYKNEEVVQTGQQDSDGVNLIRTINLNEFQAKAVEIHVIQSTNPCIHGRFDLTVIRKRYNAINQVQIDCQPRDSLTSSLTVSSSSLGGIWQTLVQDSSQFICGFQFKKAWDTNIDNKGFYGLAVKFCELTCEKELTAQSGDFSISLEVNVGDSDSSTYHQTNRQYQIFPLYFTNTNEARCPTLSTKILENCQTSSQISDNDLQIAGDNLQVNTDPIQEFNKNICIQASNKFGPYFSQTFNVQVKCPNNIVISEPDGTAWISQTYDATTDDSAKSTFRFNSFRTTTSACQVEQYSVFTSKSIQNIPNFLVVTNPMLDTHTLGTINSNSFSFTIIDGQNPYQWNFILQAIAKGGNIFYSQILTLTTQCPNSVSFTLKSSYQTIKTSFIGATGSQASYDFPQSISALPKCTDILSYEIIEVSPTNTITYPSPSCITDPCLKLDFDVSTAQIISFKIKPIDTLSMAPESQTITVNVYATEQSPSIINQNFDVTGQASSTQQVILGSSTKFVFEPFLCTSGCSVSNYQISSSSSLIVSINELSTTAILNSVTNKYEVSIDTSALRILSFYVRAELTDTPTIFAFSGKLQVEVTCGSETVSVPQSTYSMVLPKDSKTTLQEITSFFASSSPLCDILGYYAYTSVDFSTAWTDNSVILANGILTIDQTTSFKKSLVVKASTQTAHNSYTFTFVVCGNEVIESVASPSYLLQLSQSFLFENYPSLFSSTYTSSDSHADCLQTTYELKQGEACDQSPTHFTFSGDNIEVRTDQPIVDYVCVKAKTLGQQTAESRIRIEICGSEQVIVSNSGRYTKITKNYNLAETGTETINVVKEGFQFSSNNSNCPVTSHSLVVKNSDNTYSVNTDPKVSLDNFILTIDNTVTFIGKYFIETSTQANINKAYLEVDIQVCGFEQISITKSKPTKVTISKAVKYFSIRDYDKFFANNDTTGECKITSYKLLDRNTVLEYKNTSVVRIEGDDIKIYPDQSSSLEIEETISLYLQAQTNARKSNRYNITITLLSKQEINFYNGPYFIFAPQTTKVHLSTNTRQYIQMINLPLMHKPLNERVLLIDPNLCNFFRNGLPVDRPEWFQGFWKNTNDGSEQTMELSWTYQDGGKTKNLFPKVTDSGLYRVEMQIEDEIGYKVIENVMFQLHIIDYLELDYSNLDSIREIKFAFVFDVDEENCGKLKSVTKIDYEYIGNDPEEKEITETIIHKALVFDLEANQVDEQYWGVESAGLSHIKGYIDGALIAEKILERRAQGLANENIVLRIFDITLRKIKYNYEGIKMDHYGGGECQDNFLFSDDHATTYLAKWKNHLQKSGKTLLNTGAKGAVTVDDAIKEDYQKPMFTKARLINKDAIMLLVFEFDMDLSKIQDTIVDNQLFRIKAVSSEDHSTIEPQWVYNQKFINKYKNFDENDMRSNLSVSNLQFNCSFYKQESKSIYLRLDFKNRIRISQSNFGKDELEVSILKNTLLMDSLNNQTLDDNSFNKFSHIKMLPQPKSLQKAEDAANSMQNAQLLVLFLQLNQIVLQILLQGSLQDIWAMLNTQQIVIHMMLLRASQTIPGNMVVFNEQLSTMNQNDMYPTDIIFGYFFNFTEKESPIEHFEVLGYEGANFVPLTGSAFINVAIAITIAIMVQIIQFICVKLYKYEFARKIGSRLDTLSIQNAILTFYLQSFLEMIICVFLSWNQLTFEDFTQGNHSDQLSGVLLLLSIFIMGFLPVYMIIKICKNFNTLDDEDTRASFGYMYEDLDIKNLYQAMFHVIYIGRRGIFVYILVYLEQYNGLQICFHMILTMFYIMYQINFKPYEQQVSNDFEVFNEVCVMMATYILAMTTSSELTPEDKYNVGWIYILICCLNLVINFQRIMRKMIFELIPQIYRNYQQEKNEKLYEEKLTKWIKEKLDFCEKNPKIILVEEMNEIMEITKNLRISKALLISRQKVVEAQKSWLEQKGLDITVMNSIFQDYNNQVDTLISMQYREEKLNHKLCKKYQKLKAHTKEKAIKDMQRVSIYNLENESATLFQDFLLNYHQRRQKVDKKKRHIQAIIAQRTTGQVDEEIKAQGPEETPGQREAREAREAKEAKEAKEVKAREPAREAKEVAAREPAREEAREMAKMAAIMAEIEAARVAPKKIQNKNLTEVQKRNAIRRSLAKKAVARRSKVQIETERLKQIEIQPPNMLIQDEYQEMEEDTPRFDKKQ